jgi:hypothetical protein
MNWIVKNILVCLGMMFIVPFGDHLVVTLLGTLFSDGITPRLDLFYNCIEVLRHSGPFPMFLIGNNLFIFYFRGTKLHTNNKYHYLCLNIIWLFPITWEAVRHRSKFRTMSMIESLREKIHFPHVAKTKIFLYSCLRNPVGWIFLQDSQNQMGETPLNITMTSQEGSAVAFLSHSEGPK